MNGGIDNMYVQNNIIAINANRVTGLSQRDVARSTEKLSTGYRVNRAADDAAGLSVSESLRAQVRGLDRASMNCDDGISLVTIADGAMQEVHNVLGRIRDLCVQAANDTNVTADRAALALEVDALTSEVDRICMETEYNTMKIISSDDPNKTTPLTLDLQVGANTQQMVQLELPVVNATVLEMEKLGVMSNEEATESITLVDKMVDKINLYRSKMGSYSNRLEHARDNADNEGENTQSSESKIRDLDMADEMVTLSKSNIVQRAGESMMSQANSDMDYVLDLLK